MNPYPDRLDELHRWLESQYGHKDIQATEILLASQLGTAITHMKHPWIIIETDYPNRDTSDGWFAFGGEAQVKSLSVPRVQKSRFCEDIVQEWIAERSKGEPQLFIDAEWRRLPTSGRGATLMMMTHSYSILLSMCIRLRVAHPRGDHAVRFDSEADKAELARLTRRVLDNAHRGKVKPIPAIPASFLYWCELLQRLAPLQADWETLTGSIAAVARNIALLYNDDRVPDWRAAERVMRDSIPSLTAWLIEHVAAVERDGANAFQLFKQSGQRIREPVVDEIRRLHHAGVFYTRSVNFYEGNSRNNPRLMIRYRLAKGESHDWTSLLDRQKEILI
jgi:hypothetical protein